MPPPKIKLSAQAKKDLADGKSAVISYQGKQYWINRTLIEYAYQQFITGGEVRALAPTWVDGAMGPMEEILVNV